MKNSEKKVREWDRCQFKFWRKKENEKNKGESDDDFKRLLPNIKIEISDKLNKNNNAKFFELLTDNLLFIIYENDGCCLFYKIDWNRKILDNETKAEFKR